MHTIFFISRWLFWYSQLYCHNEISVKTRIAKVNCIAGSVIHPSLLLCTPIWKCVTALFAYLRHSMNFLFNRASSGKWRRQNRATYFCLSPKFAVSVCLRNQSTAGVCCATNNKLDFQCTCINSEITQRSLINRRKGFSCNVLEGHIPAVHFRFVFSTLQEGSRISKYLVRPF